jgi:HK97 gp10 family phage protein
LAEIQSFKGLKELQQALKELPERVAKNVLRGSVGAGAAVIRKEAVSKAPVYQEQVQAGHPPVGTLKKAIYQKQIYELSNQVKQTFFVGVRHGKKFKKKGNTKTPLPDAYYASWIEFGTSKMSARPFLRPAFEGKKTEAVEAIRAYLEKRIPDEVAKLPGGKK